MRPIDLDQNATTPVDPAVIEAMRPHWLAGGNAESPHAFGRSARRALDEARRSVAAILNAEPDEVVFTSGGTESNNLALFGLAGDGPGRAVATPIEHPAIAGPLARLEARGWPVDRLPVGADGRVVAATIVDRARFATMILAHNETGALQPVAELAALMPGVPVHTDAVQAVGRVPVDFKALGVTTLAASAHKFHGPAGVGLLLVRRGIRLAPLVIGGGQQGGRRPGTVPVAMAVGLATALSRWHDEADARIARWRRLRDRLEAGLMAVLGPGTVVRHGPADEAQRLPQTLHLAFPGLDGDALLMQLDLAGVAASLGSACASGVARASPTLIAMGVPEPWLRSSVRFSLGAFTTEAEVDEAIVRMATAVRRVAEAQAGGLVGAP